MGTLLSCTNIHSYYTKTNFLRRTCIKSNSDSWAPSEVDFERLREIPRGYSIAAKFTVGLLVPATIAILRFIIFEPEDGVVEFFDLTLTPPN